MNVRGLAMLAGMVKRRAEEALKDLEKKGHISSFKEGKEKFWRATGKGIGVSVVNSVTFLQCVLLDKSLTSISHYKNVQPVENISLLFAKTENLNKQLKDLGFYPWLALQTVRSFHPDYLQKEISFVKNNPRIHNPGGYLNSILYRLVSDEVRIEGILHNVLFDLSPEVKDTYRKLALELPPAEYLHLAYILRSRYRKIKDTHWQILPSDVRGILHNLQKRMRGARIDDRHPTLPPKKKFPEKISVQKNEEIFLNENSGKKISSVHENLVHASYTISIADLPRSAIQTG